MKSDELPAIEPLHQRWEPNPDPSQIIVPGLDTGASVQDQIDQIEQLITIKLQNVDANFAKIHQILSTKILPAFKRYAVNTEPVREAAKFWVSFFEQAAQIRIPTSDDYSYEPHSQAEDTETDTGAPADHSHPATFDPNITPSEASFLPGQAAVSSTPMAGSSRGRMTQQESFTSEDASSASWAASMESPLDRLDRDLKGLKMSEKIAQEDISSATPSFSSLHGTYSGTVQGNPAQPSDSFAVHQQQPARYATIDKGKGKAPSHGLRENVLRQNLRAVGDSSTLSSALSTSTLSATSPLKVKPKTPKRNPYLPPDVRARDWDGIVDLTKPATPQRGATTDWDSDDSDDDGLPPGMSPPVTIQFARLPRPSDRLGRTPVKEAAARIRADLVGDAERRRRPKWDVGEVESSGTSTGPTPPSLSRYLPSEQSSLSADPTLESMMREVGLGNPGPPAEERERYEPPPAEYPPAREVLSNHPGISLEDEGGQEWDSDESFEEGNTGAPSAAFLMASQARGGDDSFDSSNSSGDSLNGDDGDGAGREIHPFAVFNRPEGADVFDDSFDDSLDNEEGDPTVFGIPPAQRESMAATGGPGEFQVHGFDVQDDTIGIGAQLARAGVVEATPTPWAAATRRG